MKRLAPNEGVLVGERGKLVRMYRDPRPNMESETSFKARSRISTEFHFYDYTEFHFYDYADEGITWIREGATDEERRALLAAQALT